MEMPCFGLLVIMCLGLHRSSADILRRQKRNWIIDSFSIEEEHKGPFPYDLGHIHIEKKFTYFNLKGQGLEKDPKNILSINKDTGTISVHGSVDREKYSVLNLIFQALDKDSHTLDTQLGVEVKILDINDNYPLFDKTKYEISVKESATQGQNLVTVMAHDADTLEINHKFDFKMLSVTPTPTDVEFTLKTYEDIGNIGFNGCLDHEKAEKYTIILEVKDRGDKIQLSSTCQVIINIEDGNNHLPIFTGQTGPGRVKEGVENVLVWRLQVTDQDTNGTEAWRAKYKIIRGDTNYFKITTDPATNDGLLFLQKPLDYEVASAMNLSISVENEIPYQSCKVQGRKANGMWDVVKIVGQPGRGQVPPLSSRQVTVTVEDVNEPPFFKPSFKTVMVMENVAVGYHLFTFTARDPDIKDKMQFKYTKVEDPADWVRVDPKTGKITTSKPLDRESSFVKNGVYNVTLHAVDKESPPMTGTATLNIHIHDVNDHSPSLVQNIIDVCQSNGPSRANITAFDLDETPFGGPFRFMLHGDVKGKWRVDPTHGFSVSLIKEKTVYAGHHDLVLDVYDLQNRHASHNLSVTVCECSDPRTPSCRVRKATGASMGGGAFGLMFVAALLLAGAVLLALLLSCKKRTKDIPDEGSGDRLMICNTETMGTDCEVVFNPLNHGSNGNAATASKVCTMTTTTKLGTGVDGVSPFRKSASMRSRTSFYSSKAAEYQSRNSKYKTWGARSGQQHYGDTNLMLFMLDKRMFSLQVPGEELGDYAPHLYADEGSAGTNTELEAISISDIPFDPELDLDLDYKFKTLASICMPNPSTA